MFQEQDYSSDTSDEDFTVEGEKPSSDSGATDDSDEEPGTAADPNSKKRKKKAPKKKAKKNPLLQTVDVEESQTERDASPDASDNKIKEKADSLWADFMADVEDKPPPPKPKSNSWASLLGNKKSSSLPEKDANPKESKTDKVNTDSHSSSVDHPATVKVTKIFEFAGEEVRVEEEVPSDSAAAKEADLKTALDENAPKSTKPIGAAGIVDFLNKKQKLTTLEKTKIDWDHFKKDKGIEDELEGHKKSKSGYLDKRAFLERADLRQFEIEREMRISRRSKR